MKTSTKLIMVGTLLGTLGLASGARFASASPAQPPYATIPEQRDHKLTAQVSNGDGEWIAILFTFALGTATGDYLAEALKLGYAQAALVFGAAIIAITVAYYYLGMNAVLAFWLAFILTRPLGASIGDLLSQPTKNGGFGWGTVGTSMLFLSIITSLIIYLSLKQKKYSLTSD